MGEGEACEGAYEQGGVSLGGRDAEDQATSSEGRRWLWWCWWVGLRSCASALSGTASRARRATARRATAGASRTRRSADCPLRTARKDVTGSARAGCDFARVLTILDRAREALTRSALVGRERSPLRLASSTRSYVIQAARLAGGARLHEGAGRPDLDLGVLLDLVSRHVERLGRRTTDICLIGETGDIPGCADGVAQPKGRSSLTRSVRPAKIHSVLLPDGRRALCRVERRPSVCTDYPTITPRSETT